MPDRYFKSQLRTPLDEGILLWARTYGRMRYEQRICEHPREAQVVLDLDVVQDPRFDMQRCGLCKAVIPVNWELFKNAEKEQDAAKMERRR